MRKTIYFYVKKYIFINEDDKRFLSSDVVESQSVSSDSPKVLIDCSHVFYPYWSYKALAIKRACEKRGRRVDAFNPSKFFVWFTLKSLIASMIMLAQNKNRNVLKRLNFNDIKSIQYLSNKYGLASFSQAFRSWRDIKTKEDVLSIHNEGMIVGDLIYDTYLKFFKKPTVEVRSIKLLYILYLYHLYRNKVNELLDKNHYEEIYLTHSVYLAFGILARSALTRNIKVYVYQNHRAGFCKQLAIDDPMQTPNFQKYVSLLGDQDDKSLEKLRAIAKTRLEERLDGKIGKDISYMRNSFYGSGKSLDLDRLDRFKGKPRVILFLHCFFDSPHIYKWMIFSDFWEWIDQTLSYLEAQEVNVYVKRHPNALPGNEKVVKKLDKKFKQVTFIPSDIDNGSLVVDNEVSLVLTVYGTVAHEMALHNIPVVNAGANPHESFDFSLTPRNKREYFSGIKGVIQGETLPISEESIVDFYVAHYLLSDNIAVNEWDKVFGAGGNTSLSYKELIDTMPKDKFDKACRSLAEKLR